jgi:hypothetical protein
VPLFEFFKNMRFCARDGRPALFFFSESPDFALFCKNLHKVLCRFFLAGPGS